MANTIQDKLTYLSGTKDAIKRAITGKGVEVTDTDTFRSYADKITSIQTGGGGTVNLPDGTKFGSSTFTTVPTELFPYLEAQTDLSSMFKYCSSLQTAPQLDTSRVTTMDSMFDGCFSLTSVPQLDTSRVTTMDSMFDGCFSLTSVPQLDTSRVTTMTRMFSSCAITTVPLLDTKNCTNMSSIFDRCFSLTSVPQLDTSSVNDMNGMFYYCEALKTVPLLNVSNVNNMNRMFQYCYSLTNLGGLTGLKNDLYLNSSPKLTVDSVMNVINNAADMTSSSRTLILHQDVFNKLNSEQITTATAKGWNIAV